MARAFVWSAQLAASSLDNPHVSGVAGEGEFVLSLKLLFVVNIDSFFISHRLQIALEALQQGFEVHVAATDTGYLAGLKDYGLIVHQLNFDRSSVGFFSNARSMYQILMLLRYVRPNIVHLVTIKPVLLGGLVARFASVPCVVAAISGLGFVFISQGIRAQVLRCLTGFIYRLSLGHPNIKVIFQNSKDSELLKKIANIRDGNCRLIRGSGVNLRAYSPSPLPMSEPIILLAARMLVDKGVREFVEAAKILKKLGYTARFILVGAPDPGNPKTISDCVLRDWVSEEAIEWWGHCENMPQVIASSHIVTLPSYREGLPKILLEAAASGRAIITTDVPGCRDAIEPGVTGLLVPAYDSKELAGAISRLLDNPSLCKKLGAAGRKLAERSFDVRGIVKEHMRIYNELLSRVKIC